MVSEEQVHSLVEGETFLTSDIALQISENRVDNEEEMREIYGEVKEEVRGVLEESDKYERDKERVPPKLVMPGISSEERWSVVEGDCGCSGCGCGKEDESIEGKVEEALEVAQDKECRCESPSPKKEAWSRCPGHIYCTKCGIILVRATEIEDDD